MRENQVFGVSKALVLRMCQLRDCRKHEVLPYLTQRDPLVQDNGITFKAVPVDGWRRLLISDGATDGDGRSIPRELRTSA